MTAKVTMSSLRKIIMSESALAHHQKARPRKIIQIAVCDGFLYALADDGSVWTRPSGRYGDWEKIDGLPPVLGGEE